MYMNCAAVTITGGGAGLAALPEIFKANIGNSCIVPAGINVDFPNPGTDVAKSAGNAGTRPDASWGTCSKPTTAAAASFVAVPNVAADTTVDASSESTYEDETLPLCKRSVRYTRGEPACRRSVRYVL